MSEGGQRQAAERALTAGLVVTVVVFAIVTFGGIAEFPLNWVIAAVVFFLTAPIVFAILNRA